MHRVSLYYILCVAGSASSAIFPALSEGRTKCARRGHTITAAADTLASLLVELFRRLGRAVPQPRAWSSVGLASAVDGNVLGGLLLGAGMALSSSCPGMALPQLAVGIPSARAVVAGGALGGVVWSAALRPGIERRRVLRRASRRGQPPRTLASALGLGSTTTFLLYEAALAGAVAALLGPTGPAAGPSPALSPALGGALVGGGAQLVSLLLRGSLLGVSTCYEQLGDWAVYCYWRGRGSGSNSRPGTSAMLFAASMVAGAWLLARARPDLAPVYHHVKGGREGDGQARALAGGFLMAVGARAAGGCAAGHGISGMALMSTSSFVTMASAAAAAVGVSRLGI